MVPRQAEEPPCGAENRALWENWVHAEPLTHQWLRASLFSRSCLPNCKLRVKGSWFPNKDICNDVFGLMRGSLQGLTWLRSQDPSTHVVFGFAAFGPAVAVVMGQSPASTLISM